MNTPTQWSENYFRLLLDYEYELVKSPAGAQQWQPINQKPEDMAPAAHDPSKRVPTMMTTADMALKMDPEFRKISEKFRHDHEAFKDAFARAWFKLTHRDMGPKVRYLGPEVPAEPDLAGPGPGRHRAVGRGCRGLQGENPRRWPEHRPAGQDRPGRRLRPTAGRTIAAAPTALAFGLSRSAIGPSMSQKSWPGSSPRSTNCVAPCRWPMRSSSPARQRLRKQRRTPATTSRCPSPAGAATRRKVDRRRQLRGDGAGGRRLPVLKTKHSVKTEELLLDRASLLGLSAPEMTVLLAGLRVLGANYKDAPLGVFTNRKGQLTNDFFVNLLDNDTFWEVVDESGDEEFIGYDRGGKQENGGPANRPHLRVEQPAARDRRGLCREGQ